MTVFSGIIFKKMKKGLTSCIPIGILLDNVAHTPQVLNSLSTCKFRGYYYFPSNIRNQKMEKNNKENILQCSLHLFSQKGYNAVGVQEIVDSAKITKPTLYHYFGSKRGLLNELLKKYHEIFYENISGEAFYNGDIVNNLNTLAAAFFKFATENRDFYRMQLAMYFSPPECEENQAVKRMNLKIHSIIEILFEKASADHGNMKSREQALAATFVGMINTYIGLWLNGYCELNEALVHKAVHQFMHGIFS
jgi:AcrR family transcriptional regulator